MHAVTPEVQKGQVPSAPRWAMVTKLPPPLPLGQGRCSLPLLSVPPPALRVCKNGDARAAGESRFTCDHRTPGHAGDAKSSPVLRADARRGVRARLASPLAPQARTAPAVALVPTFLLSLCSFRAESRPGEHLHANSRSFL